MPRSKIIMKQQSVRCLAWLMGRGRPTTPVRLATLMWRIEMAIVVSLLLVSHVPGATIQSWRESVSRGLGRSAPDGADSPPKSVPHQCKYDTCSLSCSCPRSAQSSSNTSGITGEQWRTPEPTDLIFPKWQRKLFKTILEEETLPSDREGQPRTAYSLRHTYISLRLTEGATIYQIAKNCRTSVGMIEKYTRCTSKPRSTPLPSI